MRFLDIFRTLCIIITMVDKECNIYYPIKHSMDIKIKFGRYNLKFLKFLSVL